MKKIGLIFCIIISIIILLVVVVPQDSTTVTIGVEEDALVLKVGDEEDPEILKAWYDEEENKYHFFLPAYLKNVTSIENEDKTEAFMLEEEIEYGGNNIIVHKSSNLPALFVNTETESNEMLHSDKEIKEAGEIKIMGSKGSCLFDNEIEYITGRGNSTWDFEKKPYTLKLKEKTSLYGMEPGKKWVLLANAYEGTKIMYKMMLDLAEYMGLEHTPEAEWVDLYMNGEYKGNYLLCKAVYVGEGSVDISGALVEKDSPDYYLMEENGFLLNDNLTFSIKDTKDITEEEVSGLAAYFSYIDGLLRAGNKEYLKYLDINSAISRFLIDEISYNSDANITSCFFYKEKNSNLLMSGPVWDFDGAFGESNGRWANYKASVLEIYDSYRGDVYLDWTDLLYKNDAEYVQKVIEKYKSIEPYLQHLLEKGIDEYAAYVKESVQMDMIRWDYGSNTAGHYSTFENNVRYLKFFLSERIAMLNERWGVENSYNLALANGKMHTITYELDGEVYKETVKDGSFLPESIYDNEEIDWIYERDGQSCSEYLPIYEDMTLVGEYSD